MDIRYDFSEPALKNREEFFIHSPSCTEDCHLRILDIFFLLLSKYLLPQFLFAIDNLI